MGTSQTLISMCEDILNLKTVEKEISDFTGMTSKFSKIIALTL